MDTPVSAIPLELETNLTIALPAGFERVSSGSQTQDLTDDTFVMRNTNADFENTWLAIRRLPAGQSNTPPVFLEENTEDVHIISRCTERLFNLDLDILDSEMTTNEGSIRQRTVQIPLRTDLFLMDLTAPVKKTNEMDAIMRQVVKTIAEQNTTQAHRGIEGFGDALICLAMVALIILAVVAKR